MVRICGRLLGWVSARGKTTPGSTAGSFAPSTAVRSRVELAVDHVAVFGEPPVVGFDSVFHVGTLDPSRKGESYGRSYEGSGLSMSLHPDDWQQIARLSGHVWQIGTSSLRFMSRHDVDESQTAAAVAWAESEGLVEIRDMWLYSTGENENGDATFAYAATREEALDELAYFEDDSQPELRRVPVATELLAERTGQRFHPDEDVTDDALIVFAEQHLDVDGLWWEDDYDPDVLSCPRGVIFAGKVAALDRRKA